MKTEKSKIHYIDPCVEIVVFDNFDIVTTSGNFGSASGGMDGGGWDEN